MPGICSPSPFPFFVLMQAVGDLVGLGLAFSTLTNSLSDPKKNLSLHISLFSQTLVEESLIQTLALTEEIDFGWNLVLMGHMQCIEKGTDFTIESKSCFHLSLSLKELLNLTNPQSYSL